MGDPNGHLVAGDLGYTVGSVYTSMTGFRKQHTHSAGEVQMILMFALLHKMGFDWVDLGQVLSYKGRMGAKTVSRKSYLERFHRDRNRRIEFGHARIGGEELLYHFQ